MCVHYAPPLSWESYMKKYHILQKKLLKAMKGLREIMEDENKGSVYASKILDEIEDIKE